jgi:hypothetical protein
MKTIDYEDIVGKTVKNVYMGYSNEFLIRFEDESVLKIACRREYYGEIEMYCSNDISDYDLRNLEIISEEEYTRRANIEAEKTKQINQEWELRQLAQLKAKYERE